MIGIIVVLCALSLLFAGHALMFYLDLQEAQKQVRRLKHQTSLFADVNKSQAKELAHLSEKVAYLRQELRSALENGGDAPTDQDDGDDWEAMHKVGR
jgi:hypothetical protein